MTTGRLHSLAALTAATSGRLHALTASVPNDTRGRLHELSATVPNAFVITAADLVDLEPGEIATVDASATGGTPVTWTFTLIGAPAGLSLSGSGDSRTFTVPSSTAGAITFEIDITVSGTGASDATKRISVACLPRIEWVAVAGAWAPLDDPVVLTP